MTNAYFYSNIAVATTVTGSINSAATTVTVDSTSGWPNTFPYIIALDFGGVSEELVRVTANAANTLTIVRAFGGTSATSHAAGADVRHVHNAIDDTDFRTHEQALTGAHGVTGAFVGTTDTQTLTNKTLTAPAITNPAISGGGSLAGTFTGAPTFSGALTLSGTPSISNGAALAGTFTGSPTLSGGVVFSGAPVFTGVPDFQNGPFFTRTNATDVALSTRLTGDTPHGRLEIDADGSMNWGPGSSAADTNLYRSAANTLKTDDALIVNSTLTGNAGANFTGAVTGASFTATGVGQFLTAIKAADTTRTNTATPAADPELQLSLAANSVYFIELLLIWGGSAAGDIIIDFDGPASGDGWWTTINPPTSATSDVFGQRSVASAAEQLRTYGWADDGLSSPNGMQIRGIIYTTSPITYRLLWSQATANATGTTIHAKSWMSARRVA